jgi:UDP-N-acetylmuramoylalanine--D-glutamate ligase
VSGRFSGERALVVGAGVAGVAAAEALLREGAEVRMTDIRPAEVLHDAARLQALGAEVRAGGHDPSDLDGVTVVLVSPGVPPSAEVVTWANERGLPVWGEMELGARLATVPYLAVTGTNGKTTTTGLLAACLREGGVDAVACGNIGHPFPSAAREPHEALVVEVSSFQLALQTSFHPTISVLLNVAPDHLDWHGSFEAYADAKRRIHANQIEGDTHVGNRDDPLAASISATAPCRVTWFRDGPPGRGEVGYVGDELVAAERPGALASLDRSRAGYRQDAAAAAGAALAFGVDPDAIRQAIATFEPARHRGEVVLELDGVRYVDNSKATNVHAALAALDGVERAVLIAGGRAKGQDLSALATRAHRLVAVVAIGESTGDVAAVFDGLVPVREADTIEEATRLATLDAPAGGTVLLAPACASWDQFRDYRERGDRFAAAARALADEVGRARDGGS